MSKAFNFTDNNYLDSTGVVHHRIPLNVVLDNIGDIIYLCSYVGATSTVTLQAYAGREVNLTVEEV